MFSGFVDADFVFVLSFHHEDLEPDAQAKNTSARLCTKNAGGAYALMGGGGVFVEHYGIPPGTIADMFLNGDTAKD